MGNLAMSYSNLGRHADALAMREKVLKFLRRVLRENHPDIGEGRLGSGVTCGLLIVRGQGLIIEMCRYGHEQSRLDALQTREACGCACDAKIGGGFQMPCAA